MIWQAYRNNIRDASDNYDNYANSNSYQYYETESYDFRAYQSNGEQTQINRDFSYDRTIDNSIKGDVSWLEDDELQFASSEVSMFTPERLSQ